MTNATDRLAKPSSRSWDRAAPDSASAPRPSDRRMLGPAAAGIGYVAAWIAGLAAWPVNLALNATNGQVTAGYQAHPAAAATQFLLAEGLAGLLLGVVFAAALISGRDRRSVGVRAAGTVAAAAVAISLSQAVIGMFLITAATHHHLAQAGQLSDLVNRLDGAKMLALAALAAYFAARRTGKHRPPNWMRAAAATAAAALAVSGLDYLVLATSLAWTVYISGPLLLLWIGATGIWLTRGNSARHGCEPE